MNVVQLLTPKSAVAYLNEKMTLRQALEKMENHRYTCVPVLNAGKAAMPVRSQKGTCSGPSRINII